LINIAAEAAFNCGYVGAYHMTIIVILNLSSKRKVGKGSKLNAALPLILLIHPILVGDGGDVAYPCLVINVPLESFNEVGRRKRGKAVSSLDCRMLGNG
jgi:hypothetical protein